MSSCFFPVSLSLQSQPPGYSGNSQITNRGENPPEVTLDHVVKDLLSFFNESESFRKAKKEIEKQCEKEHGQNCWPLDDIKLAWEKTQTMNIKSRRRRHWARVIMLQVLTTSLHYDGFNRIEVQSDPKEVGTSPILSDVAKETTLSEPEQGSSEIPSTSEKRDKMATTAKRNDDSNTKVTIKKEERVELLDQSFAELCVSNKENVKFGGQKIVENPAGGTSQINAELQTAEKESEVITQGQNNKRKYSDVRCKMDRLDKDEYGKWVRGGSNQCNSQTVYIRIPLSVMSGNESTCQPKTVDNVSPTYKLIDRVPYLTEIRKKKSYAMLYDNRTRNAVWVYEILNMSTIGEGTHDVHTEIRDFKVDNSIHPFYQAPMSNTRMLNYDRGHLAAAANHRWCQEAYEDTYLLSNMTRQYWTLNRGHWRTLEENCRKDIREKRDKIRNIHVYSGPLYLTNNENSLVIYEMKSDKAVPTHFFKLIIKEKCDNTVELECYEFPNEGNLQDIATYKKPIDYIERVTGLIFTESSYDQGGTDSMETVK